MSSQETFNWIERERIAERVHAGSAGETTDAWVEGFNLVHSNFSKAHGRDLSEDQRFMAGLIAASINSMKCILDLAMAGYFMQAMNLSRLLIEIEVAYWYLRIFPGQISRSQHPKRSVPKFDHMVKKIQSHPDAPEAHLEFSRSARRQMREFGIFSHVDVSTVGSITQIESSEISISFGPHVDELRCYAVFHDTLPMVVGILGCTSNFLDFTGSGPIEEFADYVAKALIARERDEVPAGTD